MTSLVVAVMKIVKINIETPTPINIDFKSAILLNSTKPEVTIITEIVATILTYRTYK